MVAKDWSPAAGDIVWVQLSPQEGHEQAGHRPAVVLSPLAYNRKTGLMLCVPMTTRVKGYPFEVALGGDRPSVALADQVRCLDWRARQAVPKGRTTPQALASIKATLATLLE